MRFYILRNQEVVLASGAKEFGNGWKRLIESWEKGYLPFWREYDAAFSYRKCSENTVHERNTIKLLREK